jgi:ABC-type bacteriocin/lantibiotic exporter with double-glycine peptidase domain
MSVRFYRKILFILTGPERVQYFMMMGLGLVISAIEIVNLASIMPFLAVLANPGVIQSNTYLSTAYAWSGAEDDRAFLTMIGIGVFCLIVVSQSLRALISYRMISFTRACSHSLSMRLMERYLGQPYVWFLRHNTNELRRTVLQEVSQVVTSTLQPSFQIVAQGIVVVTLLTVLVIVDPVAALVVAGVIGGIYGALLYFMRPLLTRIGRQRLMSNKRRVKVAASAFESIKPVKLSGLEPYFLGKFEKQSRLFQSTFAIQKISSEIPRYVLQVILFGGIVLFILFMLSRSDNDFASIVPTLGLYALATVRMFPAFQTVYSSINQMKAGSALLDHLQREFQRTAPSAGTGRGRHQEPLRMTRSLTLEDVVYRFPGAPDPVLNELNLMIAANSTVGIVGGTGAGKTTTVDIILGLLTPDSGTVRIDNTPLTPETVERWQKCLGYVPQTIVLQDASVRDNIAFGVPPKDIDDRAVERAARAAELHDFVMRELPKGYETTVGEAGNRLSGGQRQRIGIARALYHDPDLIVLDEATSALDNLTEQQVISSIHALKENKTVIMIAHRLTTVRQCDTIFFMEKGRVRSAGSFETLYDTDAAFRGLVDAQG